MASNSWWDWVAFVRLCDELCYGEYYTFRVSEWVSEWTSKQESVSESKTKQMCARECMYSEHHLIPIASPAFTTHTYIHTLISSNQPFLGDGCGCRRTQKPKTTTAQTEPHMQTVLIDRQTDRQTDRYGQVSLARSRSLSLSLCVCFCMLTIWADIDACISGAILITLTYTYTHTPTNQVNSDHHCGVSATCR